jgi:hypothetical protein
VGGPLDRIRMKAQHFTDLVDAQRIGTKDSQSGLLRLGVKIQPRGALEQ